MNYLRWMVAIVLFTTPAFMLAQRSGGAGGFGGHGGPSGGARPSGSGFSPTLTGGWGYGYGPGGAGFGHSRPGRGNRFRGNWGAYGGYGYFAPDYYGFLNPEWDYVNFPPSGADDGGPDAYREPPPGPAPMVAANTNRYVSRPATVESPKLVEIPNERNAAPQPMQPAVFVLANGQRIESNDYVLNNHSLKVVEGRRERTIPIDELNLEATVAANQQRGIELTVPRDRNVLFLSF